MARQGGNRTACGTCRTLNVPATCRPREAGNRAVWHQVLDLPLCLYILLRTVA